MRDIIEIEGGEVLANLNDRTITGLVDALEKTGHVRRSPHPTDRRAVLVELTDTATATMDRMQREHAALNDTLLRAVDPADRAALERGVTAVAEHLEALVAEAAAPSEEAGES